MSEVPSDGLGYGILVANNLIEDKKISEIRFNYLGQFGSEFHNDLFSFCADYHGKDSDDQNHLTAKLEFNLWVVDGVLQINIIYHGKAYTTTTIDFIKSEYLKNLKYILDHIKEDDSVYLTPSDFDSAELNQEELDALFE